MDGPQNVIQGFEGYNEIPDKDQPENAPWPEDWEGAMGAVFSLILGVPDAQKPYPLRLNLDMLRWYRETMHPRNYMNTSYYVLWLLAVCFYLSQSGSGGIAKGQLTGGGGALPIVSPQELDRAGDIRGIGIHQAVPGFSKPDKDGKFSSTEYTEGKASEPKYQAGQRVATVLQASAGHTREYQYFRGRPGVIDAVYPVTVPDPRKGTGSGVYESGYADIASRGLQEYYIPIYSVRYAATDIWGADYAEPDTALYADAWETYVTPQGAAQ